MMQTVYRTNRPEESKRRDKPEDFADVEYYQLLLRHDEGKPTLFVFHGWWDELTKEAKNGFPVLEAEYQTWEEGEAAYEEQLAHYSGLGYIHSFTFNPMSPGGRAYEKLV